MTSSTPIACSRSTTQPRIAPAVQFSYAPAAAMQAKPAAAPATTGATVVNPEELGIHLSHLLRPKDSRSIDEALAHFTAPVTHTPVEIKVCGLLDKQWPKRLQQIAQKFRTITSLVFDDIDLSTDVLRLILPQCAHLTRLFIERCPKFRLANVHDLRFPETLTHVRFAQITFDDDALFTLFSRARKLATLELSACPNVLFDNYARFSQLLNVGHAQLRESLNAIALDACELTTKSVQTLAIVFPKLQTLRLSNMTNLPSVNARVPLFPQVVKLDFRNGRYTLEDVRAFAKLCPNCKEFNLFNCSFIPTEYQQAKLSRINLFQDLPPPSKAEEVNQEIFEMD